MEKVLRRDILDLYDVSGGQEIVRAAGATVVGRTHFDYLSLAQVLPLEENEAIAFTVSGALPDVWYGSIDISDFEEPVGFNAGFESIDNEGMPAGWRLSEDDLRLRVSRDESGRIAWEEEESGGSLRRRMELDAGISSSGRYSLKVENSNTEEGSISSVRGLEVPAREGRIYSVETRVKYRNADWTHVLVEGYRESEDQWVRLVLCPNVLSGTSGWQKWQCSFVMPQGITAIRPRLAAGWVKDTSKGPAVSWFDDVKISELNDSFYAELARKDPVPEITYEKLSPAKYKVTVKDAKKPFVLAFGEAFDSLWTVRLPDGQSVEPVQLYSLINGFPISRTGTYDITIEYPPQSWFHLGLLISLLAILGCLLYLISGCLGRAGRAVFRGK